MTAKREKASAFAVVWEFYAHANKQREFEKAYAPNGLWGRFFRRGDAYIRTELIRDREEPLRYLTMDVWQSRQAYGRFKKENRAEYHAIDKKCESLTRTEKLIGKFQIIGQTKTSREKHD